MKQLLQTKFVDFITSNESWHSLKLSPDTGWQQDIIRDIQRIYELLLNPPLITSWNYIFS